jgi:hypothetical protein
MIVAFDPSKSSTIRYLTKGGEVAHVLATPAQNFAWGRSAPDRRIGGTPPQVTSFSVVHTESERGDLAELQRKVAAAFEGKDPTSLRGEDVMAAWTGSAYPELKYGSDFWVLVFRQSCEWFQFSQGHEPIELFRGTVPAHKRGMAWTTDPLTAHDFAWGWLHGPDAPSGADRLSESYVYRTMVNREAILCEVDQNPTLSGRHDEKEVIVDPEALGEIECVETVARGADRAIRPAG